MMTLEERRAFRDEGLDPARRTALRVSAAATRAWDTAHPLTLDAYLDFLTALWTTFGPFATRDDATTGTRFRL